jgi:hypothetical protein
MTERKLAAIRALAERPGTPAEGQVARDILKRLTVKGQNIADAVEDLDDWLPDHARSMRLRYSNPFARERIKVEIRQHFPKGMRVYYNYWAYPDNCAGTVTGYPVDSACWAWIRIKFDHLKQARRVPIFTSEGWHLSAEPIESNAVRDRLKHKAVDL